MRSQLAHARVSHLEERSLIEASSSFPYNKANTEKNKVAHGGCRMCGTLIGICNKGKQEEERKLVADESLLTTTKQEEEHVEEPHLKLLLISLAVANPDVEYCPMLHRLGIESLRHFDLAQSYTLLHHIISVTRYSERNTSSDKRSGCGAYLILSPSRLVATYFVLMDLLQKYLGSIADLLKKWGCYEDIDNIFFVWWRQWVECLWRRSFPIRCTNHCLDLFFLEGEMGLYRTALAVISMHEVFLVCASSLETFVKELSLLSQQVFDFSHIVVCMEDFPFDSLLIKELYQKCRKRITRAAVDSVTAFPRSCRSTNTHSAHLLKKLGVNVDEVPFYAWSLRLIHSSNILTPPEQHVFSLYVPSIARVQSVVCAYSAIRDGFSLSTLYAKCRDSEFSYNILLIHTSNNQVIGAFVSSSWSIQSQFFGNGLTFVFSLRPKAHKYSWKEATDNQLFQRATASSLSIGMGESGSAIYLDASLMHGSTFPCETFGSPCLLESKSSCNKPTTSATSPHISVVDFEIANLEILGFYS